MKITHELICDMGKRGSVPLVQMMQNDSNTRQLRVKLLANGISWHVPAGVTAALAYRKPDGTKGVYHKLPDGNNASSYEADVVTMEVAAPVLSCPGNVQASILLLDAQSNAIATFPFTIQVVESPVAGETISQDYFSPWLPAASEADNGKILAVENGQYVLKTGGDGHTPVKGVDYFTEEDKAEIAAQVLAAIPVYRGEVEVE